MRTRTRPSTNWSGALDADRTTHAEGLVRVLFNVLNAPLGRLDQPGLEVEEFPIDRRQPRSSTCRCTSTPSSRSAFTSSTRPTSTRGTVERMLDELPRAARAPARHAVAALSAVPILSPAQQAFLRNGWNATRRSLPAAQAVHRYLTPGPCGRPTMRWRWLTRRARRSRSASSKPAPTPSRVLRARGIGRGHRVGLGVARDAGLLVALLGVLKAGAAYVPLDPGFPMERLSFMAGDAGLSALLVRGVPADWLAAAGRARGCALDIAAGRRRARARRWRPMRRWTPGRWTRPT